MTSDGPPPARVRLINARIGLPDMCANEDGNERSGWRALDLFFVASDFLSEGIPVSIENLLEKPRGVRRVRVEIFLL